MILTAITLVAGMVLMALGGGAYSATGGDLLAVVVPAAIGIGLYVLGACTVHLGWHHLAVAAGFGIAVTGVAGSLLALPDVVALLRGQESSAQVVFVKTTLAVMSLSMAAVYAQFLMSPRNPAMQRY